MKTKLLLILICIASLNIGCNTDDDTIPEVTLYTTWSLRHVDGSFGGVNDSFEQGDIVWYFDAQSGILTVENNNTDEALFDILETGTYVYTIITENDYSRLYVDDIPFGTINLSLTELHLDDSALDGMLIAFERFIVPLI